MIAPVNKREDPLVEAARYLCETRLLPADTYDKIGGNEMLPPAGSPAEMEERRQLFRRVTDFCGLIAGMVQDAAKFNLPTQRPDLIAKYAALNGSAVAASSQMSRSMGILVAKASVTLPANPLVDKELQKNLSDPAKKEKGTFSFLASFLRIKATLVEGFLQTTEQQSQSEFMMLVREQYQFRHKDTPASDEEQARVVKADLKKLGGEMRYAAECLDTIQQVYNEKIGRALGMSAGAPGV